MNRPVPSSHLAAEYSATAPRKRMSLRYKATIFAIALGTLPVLLTGGIAYLIASRPISQQIMQGQRQRTEILAEKFELFLVDRLHEVESLGQNQLLTEPALRTLASQAQKQAILEKFVASLKYYDSVILFDPDGNPIAQAATGKPFRGNYGDRAYFQTARESGNSTMNGPGLSPSSGKLRVEYAVPVKDSTTQAIIYIIRARIPGDRMERLFKVFEANGDIWQLLNSKGIAFAGVEKAQLAQPAEQYYPGLMALIQSGQSGAAILTHAGGEHEHQEHEHQEHEHQEHEYQELVSYAPLQLSADLPAQPITALIATKAEISFAPQRDLLFIFVLGTGMAAVVIGAITTAIANRAIRPIQQVTQVAQQVVQTSNFALQSRVKTQDEIGLLSDALNQLIRWAGQYTGELERNRETLEQRVQARTQQLNTIIDNLGDGLLAVDSTSTIVLSNPALLAMFGLPEQSLAGQPVHEIFSAELAQLLEQHQCDRDQLLTIDLKLPNNRVGQALVTTITSDQAETSAEQSFGSIVLIRDITSEKEIAQMKTDFISTVSHELRTPLTSVLGFAKLIQKKLEDTLLPAVNIETPKVERTARQVQENLRIIVSEGDRLTALINDVLDIAKIEAGKIEWNMQPLQIADIIEQAIAATAILAQASGIEVMDDIADDLPEIVGDRDRLLQVIFNLVSNALKFTDSGSVTCRAQRQHAAQQDEIVVSIIDTGIGLSPEDLDKVFDRFTQVGEVMTDKPKGTGLGLPICKQIVEHHGGRIWAESQLGQGSTFSFSLPLSRSLSTGLASSNLQTLVQQLKVNLDRTISPEENQQKTILVVDDEPPIRELLRQELEAEGYQVKEARDGMEALKQIDVTHPDLIVLDVMMPNIDGFDLAAVVKNNPETMGIPIIMLSIMQERERGYRLGVDRYLYKPIDTEALLKDIKMLLG